jgi:hypothetical protein
MGDRRIWIVIAAAAALFVAVLVIRGRPGVEGARDEEARTAPTQPRGSASEVRDAGPPPRSSRSSGRLPPAGHASEPDEDQDFSDAPFAEEDEEAARAARVAAALAADEGHLWTTDAEGIQSAVFESLDGIRECYEGWLELQPDLEGEIVVRFVITEDDEGGSVSGAEVVDGTLPEHTFFDGCVLNVMSAMRFEAPADGGEVVVNYPFAFSSG